MISLVGGPLIFYITQDRKNVENGNLHTESVIIDLRTPEHRMMLKDLLAAIEKNKGVDKQYGTEPKRY